MSQKIERGRRLAQLAATSLCLATLLGACGSGGGGAAPPPPCAAGVSSGFTGDLEAVYSGGVGASDGGASGDSGGGDDGAGGGLGKTLGARLTMTRLADGSVLGSASTDATQGLATLHVCKDTGPVLLTLEGQAGANYYDEGKGALVPFPAGRVLHALVDTFDENVGVSPLTEAAYRWALNNLKADPAQVAAGSVALRATGSVTGLTAAQVRQANQTVLDEVNRLLPAASRLTSLKALPTPLDAASAASVLKTSRYGFAAVVTGGLVNNAQAYLPDVASPALAMADQIARDLTDGVLNGFALDGSAAAAGDAIAYDALRLPVALDAGNYALSGRYGQASTFLVGTGLTDFTLGSTYPNGDAFGGGCVQTIDNAALLKDGSVNVLRIAPRPGETCATATESTLYTGFARNVKLLRSVQQQVFVVHDDGSVAGWGDSLCGVLGTGLASGRATTPATLPGLANVTSLSTGTYFGVARDRSGAVWTWGSDLNGQLGLGAAPAYDLAHCAFNSGVTPATAPGAMLVPRKVPGLSGVVTVGADQLTALALDARGDLWQWGLVVAADGSTQAQPVPAKVAGLSNVVATAPGGLMVFALRADGTVWGFGLNGFGNFGDGSNTPKPVPAPVPGLSGIVQLAGDAIGGAAALKRDGTVLVWDGSLYRTPTTPTVNICVVPNSTSRDCITSRTGPMPKMRHVVGNGFAVQMVGVDGSLYFRYAGTNQLVSVQPSALGGTDPP